MLKYITKYILILMLFYQSCKKVFASDVDYQMQVSDANEELSTMSYDTIVSDLSEDIGEETTQTLFKEIKTELSELATITKETISEIIDKISAEYGVLFTEEQKEVQISYNEKLLEKTESDGLIETIINAFKNFWEWLKGLHQDSEFEITETNGGEDLVEAEGDTVTINIPTVKEVDTTMDKIIAKIKAYVFPEE